MLLTEEQAKEKWCPYKYRMSYGAPANEDPECFAEYVTEQTAAHPCIGSKCMAFRWVPDAEKELKSGLTVIVDQEDKDMLDQSWWFDGRYAKGINNEYLHRTIVSRALGAIPDGMFVDHIDGDTLNNRRGNLRVVTKAENAANATARGGKSQFRGVFKTKNGRWAAQISKGRVRLSLGTFDTEHEAASAYDEAAKEIHGTFARLNLEVVSNSGRRGYCGAFGRPES